MTGASADICEAQAVSSAHIPLRVTKGHSKDQKTGTETGPVQGVRLEVVVSSARRHPMSLMGSAHWGMDTGTI